MSNNLLKPLVSQIFSLAHIHSMIEIQEKATNMRPRGPHSLPRSDSRSVVICGELHLWAQEGGLSTRVLCLFILILCNVSLRVVTLVHLFAPYLDRQASVLRLVPNSLGRVLLPWINSRREMPAQFQTIICRFIKKKPPTSFSKSSR